MTPRSLWGAGGALVLIACGGGGGSPTGTPTTPGPTSPAPVIASWSPSTPFWGDTVTITGSGFSATPSQNHVWFRKQHQLCFNNTDTSAAVVVSATPTQLRVRAPYIAPPSTDVHPQNCTRSSIRVAVNGGPTAESATFDAFMPPRVRTWRSADGTAIARGGTSVTVTVEGHTTDPDGYSILVNGVEIPSSDRTQTGPIAHYAQGQVTFTVPFSASPGTAGDGGSEFTAFTDVPVSLSSRGRTAISQLAIRRYPPMGVDSVRSVIVPSGTPGAPDSRELTVWVRNLVGPVEHRWNGTASQGSFADALSITNLYTGPLTFSQIAGTPTGTYNVSLRVLRFDPVIVLSLGPHVVP